MATLPLNALKKAPIRDQADAQVASGYNVVSSNLAVATVSNAGSGNPWFVTGVAAGVSDVTVTRILDGAVVTHQVEVIAAVPFDWHLGPEVPA